MWQRTRRDQITCSTTCQSLSWCGDGAVEPANGEECDPPNGTSCNSQCRTDFCGNGRVDPDEVCDPSSPSSPPQIACDANCHITTCGNGQLDAGEQCDPPLEDDTGIRWCTGNCQVPRRGNLIIDAGEDCDPPDIDGWLPGTGGSTYCGMDCQTHDARVECHQLCDADPTGFETCAQLHCYKGPYSPCG